MLRVILNGGSDSSHMLDENHLRYGEHFPMKRWLLAGFGFIFLMASLSPAYAFFSYKPRRVTFKKRCLKRCFKRCRKTYLKICPSHSKLSHRRPLCSKQKHYCRFYCPKRCASITTKRAYCRRFQRLVKRCSAHLHWWKICKRVKRSARYCRTYNSYYIRCKRARWRTRFCRRWYHLRRLCSHWKRKERFCRRMRPRFRHCLRRSKRFRFCRKYPRWRRRWK